MELNRGINLGGYLSQCTHSSKDYAEFICEEDIKRISNWGFDHVRLPFDYDVLETKNGKVIKDGYDLLQTIINWCRKYQLNVILDLHKAFGYDFNNAGNNKKNNLFSDEFLKKRFVGLWKKIAEAFGTYDYLAFELLNEVVESENADSWNKLIDITVEEIRKITADTPIIYGGIQWNSAKTVCLLEKPKNKNIIFTFHFYEPLLFTHQKAHWVEAIDNEKDIFYPQTMEYYQQQSVVLGEQGETVVKSTAKTMGPEFIENLILEAVSAAQNAGVSIYCGEFGVIDKAPLYDTLRWFEDINKVFRKHKIGYAVWTYKEKDFGLIGKHYDDIRGDLISLWMEKDS